MLEELLKESIDLLEKKFYSKEFKFSYSSISKLLFNPAIFYQMYILGLRNQEEKAKHLIEGSVIHCLLLEPDKFPNKFIITPVVLPSDPVKKVLDFVLKKHLEDFQFNSLLTLDDFKESVLEGMILTNYFQKLKSDDDRLSKILIPEAYNYIEYNIIDKEGRELIDVPTYSYCKNAVSIINNTKGIKELLGQREGNIEVYNEIYLEGKIDDKSYGLKGFLDNLVIDHDTKTITINDFKTTSKDLKEFPNSVEFYKYWLQAVIYMLLAEYTHGNLNYELNFNFIVVDKYLSVYAFPVSNETMLSWIKRYKEVINMIDYHYENNRYELPYEFDTGKMVL